jgi:predicted RNA polymerase sigma factor
MKWNRMLIGRGLAALAKAEALGGTRGFYVLQAAITACHARAPTAADTDWHRITELYETLAQVAPSPIVELNRAVAIGMAYGPDVGLQHVDTLRSEPALAAYHLLPAVRADFLIRLGRTGEARVELEHAASLTRNARERALLLARAASCGD